MSRELAAPVPSGLVRWEFGSPKVGRTMLLDVPEGYAAYGSGPYTILPCAADPRSGTPSPRFEIGLSGPSSMPTTWEVTPRRDASGIVDASLGIVGASCSVAYRPDSDDAGRMRQVCESLRVLAPYEPHPAGYARRRPHVLADKLASVGARTPLPSDHPAISLARDFALGIARQDSALVARTLVGSDRCVASDISASERRECEVALRSADALVRAHAGRVSSAYEPASASSLASGQLGTSVRYTVYLRSKAFPCSRKGWAIPVVVHEKTKQSRVACMCAEDARGGWCPPSNCVTSPDGE